MKYFDLVKEKLSSLWPMWLLIMLVAFWSIYIQDGYINRDGLLYLKQAHLFGLSEWKQGLNIYSWPLFGILISIVHKITHIHSQWVAHGIDLILFGIAAIFYLKIIRLIYKGDIIFYGGLALLSFIPIMDDYLGMILRDHGLWAGCMAGTYYYLCCLKDNRFKFTILFQMCFLVAGLFRPEALVFPVIIFIYSIFFQRRMLLNQLYFFIFSIFVFVIIILLMPPEVLKVLSVRFDVIGNFFHQKTSSPIITYNEYLTILLDQHSKLFLLAGLTSVLFLKWAEGYGLLHGFLFFHSTFQKKSKMTDEQHFIYLCLSLSFVIVWVNLLSVYVLTNRYWGFHWWWMMILIVPSMKYFMENKKLKVIKLTVIFLVFTGILNPLYDRKKNVDFEVATYIKNNNLHEKIHYSKTDRIEYYINRNIEDVLNKKVNFANAEFILKPAIDITEWDEVVKSFPENKPKYFLVKK